MNVSQDPHKPPSSVRCYNCNAFGHLACNCPWPPCCTPSGPVSTGCTYQPGRTPRSKSLHVMEEISEVNSEGKEEAEEEYQPEDFNPDSNSSGHSLTVPTEYDPCEPELQLQYLDNEVNIMEVKEYLKKEQKKVDTGVDEDELFPITCPFCDYCCNNWDTPPESGSNELKAGSPSQDDDSWRPKSPDEAYLNSLHQWTSITPPPDASKDKPEEMYCFSSSSLPIYMTEIGSPKVSASAAETANVPVKTILDTGAESNYVLAKKAWEAGVTL